MNYGILQHQYLFFGPWPSIQIHFGPSNEIIWAPLPATTAKSLLYNGRISEEVSSLLVCRDENLVTQLAHSLNQVSTEHM